MLLKSSEIGQVLMEFPPTHMMNLERDIHYLKHKEWLLTGQFGQYRGGKMK